MRKQFLRRKRFHVWAMPGFRFGFGIIPLVQHQYRHEALVWLGPILIGFKFRHNTICPCCGRWTRHRKYE